MSIEERVEKLEDVVSGLKQVPSDVFEDSEGETVEANVSSSTEKVESDTEAETKGNDETCEVEKSDGEICGREKPCPYHGEE